MLLFSEPIVPERTNILPCGILFIIAFFKQMDSVTFFGWHVYVEGKFSTSQQNDKRVHVCMSYSLMNMSYVYVELSM